MLIAHGGHWLVNVAYLAPVVGLLAWLGLATYKERRGAAAEENEPKNLN